MQHLDELLEKLEIDPAQGFQAIDSRLLAERYYPPVNVGWPLLVLRVRDGGVADEIRSTLLAAYPEEHEVIVLSAQGEGARKTHVRVTLDALSEVEGLSDTSSVYIPPLPAGKDFTDLQDTIAHLRSPVGCPWDREQTLASLRKDLLSECVEVLEAIDLDMERLDNRAHIAEELGDVLLLVTMMVQIATDDGRFRMSDVVDQIVTKLIRRHPHVFGDASVSGSDDVVANWDAIKAQEKAEKGVLVESPLAGIPAELPALEKARELQSKAAKAGLLDRAALAGSLPSLTGMLGPDISEDSVGELLWVLAAFAREHGIVAENALRRYAVTYRHKVEDSLMNRDGDQTVDVLS
jgi:tetrapyrrole methylase family protein/MazG family protein